MKWFSFDITMTTARGYCGHCLFCDWIKFTFFHLDWHIIRHWFTCSNLFEKITITIKKVAFQSVQRLCAIYNYYIAGLVIWHSFKTVFNCSLFARAGGANMFKIVCSARAGKATVMETAFRISSKPVYSLKTQNIVFHS